jgi:hypothetical protein
MKAPCNLHINETIWIVRFDTKKSKCKCCFGRFHTITRLRVVREKIIYLSTEGTEYLVNFDAYWFYTKELAMKFAKINRWTAGKPYGEVFDDNDSISPKMMKEKP